MRVKEIGEKLSLSLRNDGELEVFHIGVGSAFARTLFQMNFLIVKGGAHIMVDFGMTGPVALRATSGLEPTDIEVLLPTHSHADHVGGIECLALMNRYVGVPRLGRPKLKMIVDENYEHLLWSQSLMGGLEWNEFDADTSQRLRLTDFFDVVRPEWTSNHPREVYEVEHEGIHLELFRTNHIPEQAVGWQAAFRSYGLFIDGRVFHSVDTKFDPELIADYAPRSEVMFHDVQFFPGAVHAPLEDLRGLDQEVKRKMLLVHYADDWQDQDITGFAGWTRQGVSYVFD